jgi:hypothetical protein
MAAVSAAPAARLIAQAVFDDEIIIVDAAFGFDPVAAVVAIAAVHDGGGK